MAFVRYGLGDFALHIVQIESVTDSDLMEAIKFAADLRDETVFLKLIKGCQRSRRVFKQHFIHQQWQNTAEHPDYERIVGWIYRALYRNGENNLALFVAASKASDIPILIADFCFEELEKYRFDIKKSKYKYALKKLSGNREYGTFAEELYTWSTTSQSCRSFLFCHAIRDEDYSRIEHFCEHSISREDLQFATFWLLLGNADYVTFEYIRRHLKKKNDRRWLQAYAIETTMNEYLRLRSNTSMKTFLRQFPNNFRKSYTRVVFKDTIQRCLDHDCADLFVALCRKRCKNCKDRVFETNNEDFVFAYSIAVEQRPHFISKLCKKKISRQHWSGVSELLLLFDAIVTTENWNLLSVLPSGLNRFCIRSISFFELLRICVIKTLSNQSSWAGVAPALDHWMKEEELDFREPETVIKDQLKGSLKGWCMETGHVNLAFFLAVVFGDWKMAVSSFQTEDLHPNVLWAAVRLAANKGFFSLSIELLKTCTMNFQLVDSCCPFFKSKELAKVCENQGLLDWSLVLQCYDLKYIQDSHMRCQNDVVLNSILRKAVSGFGQRWDIARERLSICTDAETLTVVLLKAFQHGQKNIAKVVISRVNPTRCGDNGRTLLYYALACFENRKEMLHLCVRSGLTTFQGYIKLRDETQCPLLFALRKGWVHLIKLLLAGGVYSHSSLCEITNRRKIQDMLHQRGTSKKWKEGYRCIEEAAATPCRLEHLARLVVSHNVGCQPGRADRINMLPLPPLLKDMIHFKDVLDKKESVKYSKNRAQFIQRLLTGEVTAVQLRSACI